MSLKENDIILENAQEGMVHPELELNEIQMEMQKSAEDNYFEELLQKKRKKEREIKVMFNIMEQHLADTRKVIDEYIYM